MLQAECRTSETFNASVVSACDDNYRPEPFEWGPDPSRAATGVTKPQQQ